MLKKLQLSLLILAILSTIVETSGTIDRSLLKKTIEKMYSHLQTEQVQEDQPFKKFPPQFSKQKGLYSSDVKLNVMDKSNSFLTHVFRETFNVFDNNMFVTNFVVLGLVEAANLGQIPLDLESLELALDSLLTFKDKNQLNITTPVYNFWQQINVNGTWQSYPSNLEGIMSVFDSLPAYLQNLIKLIGIDPKELQQMVSSFVIPPDNDDSGINIALGSLLRLNKENFPSLYQKWESANNDYEGFYRIVKKYAYRPLNSQFPSNYSTNASDIIDPRSYYYLHDFIQGNDKYPISLFSTWLINQNDEKSHVVKQPFHTNNVDMTVNANSLLGLNSLLTSLPLEEALQLFSNDQDLQGIHRNVTNLLVYGIESGVVLNRTDLALTYYPSEYDFYWFVARNVHLLRTASLRGELPFEELKYSLQSLENALLNVGVNQLLALSQRDSDGNIYWEGFLGNYANKTYHEDRLFSTAVTLNTLLDAYTVTSIDSKSRQYIAQTPEAIKTTIFKAVSFITGYYNKLSTPYMNAFFSGSVKGFSSLPFFYPSNYGLYLNNGTEINTSQASMNNINDDLIVAFKGSVSQTQYEQLLNQTWFGVPTPTTFSGFNEPNNGFPFWSSKSATQIFMIQGLSKYSSLVE